MYTVYSHCLIATKSTKTYNCHSSIVCIIIMQLFVIISFIKQNKWIKMLEFLHITRSSMLSLFYETIIYYIRLIPILHEQTKRGKKDDNMYKEKWLKTSSMVPVRSYPYSNTACIQAQIINKNTTSVFWHNMTKVATVCYINHVLQH